MPLNYKEIELLLSELPLQNSRIQKVYQLEIHTLIFEMHHQEEHFWQLYVELGTDQARFHRINGSRYVHPTMKKGTKQRFNQYLSSHIEGMIIEKVEQVEEDRLFTLFLKGSEETLLLHFRFYSASKSNVIVTSTDYVIQDLMYRRPKNHETSGETLVIEEKRESTTSFRVREYDKTTTFNEYIESLFMGERKGEKEQLLDSLAAHYEKLLASLLTEKDQLKRTLKSSRDYSIYKNIAELLSSNGHLIHKGMDSITLLDGENSTQIPLNPLISSGENITHYYDKYHKEKHKMEYIEESIISIDKKISLIEEKRETLLDSSQISLTEIRKMHSALNTSSLKSGSKYSSFSGLYFNNGKYDILVGRNADENEELLKKIAKGNDYWMHTRDVAGGYVIIKYIKNKQVDLETILDAGNLAILFSKAKTHSKADLYFTQVKYLKKVKGGKKGLVLPTNEKNYTISRDEERITNLYEKQTHLGEIQ
ncbi:MAG: DUF814 domain-containing protein [Spirochaetia bacterium]|nr:DUF814 domain-containing protein [Spirochaetia bacterium]